MKKALALLAATAVLASAALTPAVGFTAAAEGYGSIAITDSYSETYSAYQIFAGTITDQDGNEILTSIKWGSSISEPDSLLAALQTDSVIGLNFASCESAEDVANVIKDWNSNSDNLIIFANIVAAFCTGSSCGTFSSGTISGLDSGYYLVAGTAADDTYTTTSRYILTEVNGNNGANSETATAKNALPSVQKFVLDETDDAESGNINGWGESADHDTYETFQFALEANLPEEQELSYYNNYQITFHDTYNVGIAPDLTSIKVYVTNDTEGDWKTSGFTNTSTYVDITNDCTTTSSGLSDGCSFEVTVDDLVASLSTNTDWSLGETALSVIVVYDAELNQDAEVWSSGVQNGIPKTDNDSDNQVDYNVVYLTYSNNPNYAAIGESTNEDQQSEGKWKGLDYENGNGNNDKPANKAYEKNLGTTPKDYVWLFTYEIDITKTDESNSALEGAEFSLTRGESEIIYFIQDSEGIYWVTDSTTSGADKTLTSDSNGKITVKGLDAGNYTLSETKAPEGYNLAEDKTVTITATHEEDDSFTTVSNVLNGSDLEFTIVDKSGTTLPTTGGIGTTVFYVIGGIIVVGAGVLLITRKRANNV